ncbi:MAG: type IV toxin-antitoxin system AbiEi family antitoxin domain-containing protein [Actinomycetota bacterium]
MPLEARIAALAAEQHGLVTRRHLRALGCTDSSIDRRIQSGRVEVVHRGIFRVGGSTRSWEQSLKAATLIADGRSWASHRAAARIWRLGVSGEVPIEISSVARIKTHRPEPVVHRVVTMPSADQLVENRIPITSPARTLIDLGSVLPPDRLEEALDDGLRRRVVTIAWLRWRLERLDGRGKRGSGRIRRLVDERHDGKRPAESFFEILLEMVVSGGLPDPVRQVRVYDGTELVGRVDLAYPEQRIAIEADGYGFHSSPGAFRRDRARDNRLHALGWTVLRFTWRDLDHPAAVVDTVRRTLLTRRVRRGAPGITTSIGGGGSRAR